MPPKQPTSGAAQAARPVVSAPPEQSLQQVDSTAHAGSMTSQPGTQPRPASAAPMRGGAAAQEEQKAGAPSNQQVWSLDAPLPSVRSARGREEFLQTPAFVIAAHYTRGDTLRSQTHAKELRDKLKQTARFQKGVVKEKMDVEQALQQSRQELEVYKKENKQLQCKVHQLAEEVLALQRQARDSKSAMAIMAQQAQEKRVAVGSAQQLRLELGEAYAEVARLQALLQASGVRC